MTDGVSMAGMALGAPILGALALVAQAVMLGGVAFLLGLARPQGWLLGPAGEAVQADAARIAAWAALALVLAAGGVVALRVVLAAEAQGVPLTSLSPLSPPVLSVLKGGLALAGLVRIAIALLLAATLFGFGGRAPGWLLVPLAAAVLAAGLASGLAPHGTMRPELAALLLGASALHQLGAALWIGGLPCLLAALRRAPDDAAAAAIGTGFARLALLGAGCVAAGGAVLAWGYVGDFPAVYGTAYGALVGAKLAVFVALLLVGLAGLRTLGRLQRRWGGVARLRRLARLGFALGLLLFALTARLAVTPPSVTQPHERVSLSVLIERHMPWWLRLDRLLRDRVSLPVL